uniref:xanthine dehydrogenase family protein molybdopterin-binding subunit n=1 Tax=Altererythrobacter segetis TaxID=1104773 RepID=UPI00140AACDC|nr:molybdopterin cofactor-binding domain-containing protein [Altererythrobacter segetis]
MISSRIAVHALTRRSFLISASAVNVVLLLGSDFAAAGQNASFTPNAWVAIDEDDYVTIVAPAAEMGQGVRTALPLILAEELDADWSRVRVTETPQDSEVFGNPAFTPLFGSPQLTTVSSLTVAGYYDKLRLAGAQARKILMTKTAGIWNVPLNELSTAPGQVLHVKTGRTMSFGAIAKHPSAVGYVADVTLGELKKPSHFRLIGRDVGRVDVPSKVDGSARYAIDTQQPGMLYACVAFPEVQHERPMSVDDSAAKGVPGVIKIVSLPVGVGIIAENIEAAMLAKSHLKVEWSATSKARDYDSDLVLADYQRLARDRTQAATTMFAAGNSAAAIEGSASVLTAEFFSEHLAHMTMEPLNVTVKVDGDVIDIWSGTQGPTRLKMLAAQFGHTTPDKVNVHAQLLGGAFGRRLDGDDMLVALMLAQSVPGRPVKMIWLREDDIRNDKLRPLTAQRVELGLNAEGDILGWRHRIVNESYLVRILPPMEGELRDEVSGGGGEFSYAIPNHSVEWVRAPRGVDVGAWRGIAAGFTKFAIEVLIDEVAVLRRMDPLAYRLSLLGENPRAIAVLNRVAKMARYDTGRKDRAVGIAYSDALRSHTAAAAEVSVDPDTGKIVIHHLWAAIDAGIAVQPGNVVAQVTGAMVFGLGAALKEQMAIKGGVMQAGNFHNYPVLRMSEIPPMEVSVISTDNPPSGIAEAGVPIVAPAIANAVAKLTGKRLRHLPMTPQRVREALQ